MSASVTRRVRRGLDGRCVEMARRTTEVEQRYYLAIAKAVLTGEAPNAHPEGYAFTQFRVHV